MTIYSKIEDAPWNFILGSLTREFIGDLLVEKLNNYKERTIRDMAASFEFDKEATNVLMDYYGIDSNTKVITYLDSTDLLYYGRIFFAPYEKGSNKLFVTVNTDGSDYVTNEDGGIVVTKKDNNLLNLFLRILDEKGISYVLDDMLIIN